MGTQIQDAELDDAALRRLPGQRRPPDAVRARRDPQHPPRVPRRRRRLRRSRTRSSRPGLRLEEWGLGEQTLEHNRAAAALAREMCDEFATADWPRFVAGSIGPTGMLPSGNDPTLSAITYPRAGRAVPRADHRRCSPAAPTCCMIETMQDILETRAAITGARRAFAEAGRAVPLQVSVALDVTGRMLLGTDIGAVARDPPRHEGRHHRH